LSILDVHNHVIPTDVIDLLNSEPSYGVSITDGHWRGVHHVPFPVVASFFDVAAKLQHLDRVGIDAAVISAPPPLFFYEQSAAAADRLCTASNEGFARFCAGAPARLRWLANLPLQDPDLAVASYRAAVAAGAAGAALGTSVEGRRLDEPEFERFWAIAGELGLPVLLHPAFNEPHAGLSSWYLQNVIGNPLETTVAVERLLCAGTLHRHAGLRLILLHGGGFFPYQAGRLRHARGVRPELADTEQDLLAPLDRLYFDTITHDPQALRFLLQQVGEGHVVLGTDMPFDMAMQEPMSDLRAALPDEVVWRIAEDVPNALFAATPTGEAAASS
jgi:aminocarboxymuconate-semialdehyde decarboxylase